MRDPINVDSNDTGSLDDGPTTAPNGGGTADRLLAALKGVQAPPQPQIQRIGTPALPRVNPVKTGELQQLMLALGGGNDGLKLPSTLGAALRS